MLSRLTLLGIVTLLGALIPGTVRATDFNAAAPLAAVIPIETSPAAECPRRPKKEARARKLAGRWFSKGEKFFADGQYDPALAAFRCSMQLVPHAVTSYNAAQAASHGRHRQEALDLGRQCLSLEPSPEIARQAQELVDRLEAELEAERQEQLAGQQAPPPNQLELNTDQAIGRDSSTDGPFDLRVTAYLSLTAGGVALVSGLVLQLATGALHSRSEETDQPLVYAELRDAGQNFQKGAIVSYVIAGVAASAGLTLLVLHRYRKKKSKKKGMALLLGPGAIGVGGRF